ncbi:dolichol-phosphate mannosyltransferase [Sphingomonas sp. CCH5-D11]|uniref:dolichol-phosphate mannosyltransferase n=1 Tax=Sphingomonas sp. CCH5-D11 TaxID=1768786 RepID=UPI000A6D6571|nr:dolichol-phosphate mannosyltransferase [Sphingomonas sp. CCH5-D11]
MNAAGKRPLPDLSVILCVMDRIDEPGELLAIYRRALAPIGNNIEFIYILAETHPRVDDITALSKSGVRVIHMPKLCGEISMLREAIAASTSDLVMTLPPYLQVEPGVLAGLAHDLEGADMVAASRIRAKDSLFNRARASAYRSATRLTGTRFDDLGCRVRLFRRSVLDRVVLRDEHAGYLPIFAEHAGCRVKQVKVPQAELDRRPRSYNLPIYFDGLLDAVSISFLIRFLQKPFRLFGTIGAALFASGFALACVLIIERVMGQSIAERPALLLSVLLLVLGIQVAAVGLIAEVILFTRLPASSIYRVRRIIEHVSEVQPENTPVHAGHEI